MKRVYVPPKKYDSVILSWHDITACPIPPRKKGYGCDWITFESIDTCLKNNHLEDVNVPQTIHSHHAARIASLVKILQSGELLTSIHFHVGARIAIYDGNHRFRAYQFTGLLDNIPSIITGYNKHHLIKKD